MINFSFSKPSSFLKYTFIIAIIVFAARLLIKDGSIETWGANKTVGWALDFCSMAELITVLLFAAAAVIYLLLWIFNMRLNNIVSVIQISLFFILGIFNLIEDQWVCYNVMIPALAFGTVMVLNTGFAIGYKISDNRKKHQ